MAVLESRFSEDDKASFGIMTPTIEDAGSTGEILSDPLGAQFSADSLAAAPVKDAAAQQGHGPCGMSSADAQSPLQAAVRALACIGSITAQVQVLHAFWLQDKSLLFIGHLETEFALMRSRADCSESDCDGDDEPVAETAAAGTCAGGAVSSESCALSNGIPISPDLKYPQISETEVNIIHRPMPGGARMELGCKFASKQMANLFVERLQKVHSLVCGLQVQHSAAMTHRWLFSLTNHPASTTTGSCADEHQPVHSASGSIDLSPSRQQDSANLLLQSSSSFWSNVNEEELLDPDRRRRLTSSVAAGPSGAANVSIIPVTTLGVGSASGLPGLPSRTEIRDGRPVAIYEINLVRRNFKWSVSRRYNDFVVLRDVLLRKQATSTKDIASSGDLKTIKFPKKGLGRPSTDPEIIFERSTGLLAWLTTLMRDEDLCRAVELLSFIGMKAKLSDDQRSDALGSNYWNPPTLTGRPRKHQTTPGQLTANSGAIASVDRLGRSIAQVLNEQNSQTIAPQQLDLLSEHLVECRTFQNALLALTFNVLHVNCVPNSGGTGANSIGRSGGKVSVHLRLVSDILELEYAVNPGSSGSATGGKAVATEIDGSAVEQLQNRAIRYEDIISVSQLPGASQQLLIKGYERAQLQRTTTPRHRHTSLPSEWHVECTVNVDAQRLVEEIDDRMQLAHHIAKREKRLSAAVESGCDGNGSARGDSHIPYAYCTMLCDSRRQDFASRLDGMTGMNEEHRVAAAVDRILHGERAQDRVEVARPMHEFIRNRFQRLPQKTAAAQVREVIDSLQTTLLEERAHILHPLLINILPEETGDETQDSLPRLINRCLENALVSPLRDKIIESIRNTCKHGNFARQRTPLRSKPQSFYGIDAAHSSPSGWAQAVQQLECIGRSNLMPSEMLTELLRTATVIHDTFVLEHKRGDSDGNASDKGEMARSSDVYLAGDDFLPIFIFVVVRSDVEELPLLLHFMQKLCDPDLLAGKGGYYLTVLESVLECVRSADASAPILVAARRSSPLSP
eukprot:SAG31_NODE_1982_length_6745_cov_8.400090_3_plen_1022_part_00